MKQEIACESYINDGYSNDNPTQCIGCLNFSSCMYFYNRDPEYQRGFRDGMKDRKEDNPSKTHLWTLKYEFLKGYDKGYRDGYYNQK